MFFGDNCIGTNIGDARTMSGFATGGNGTLYGDAEIMLNSATGGFDTFVFSLGDDNDTIGDFRSTDGDQIDIKADSFDFSKLDTTCWL